MLDIKFSIRYPGSHSRKNEVHISNPGDPTYFVESLHNTLKELSAHGIELYNLETIEYYIAANAYRNRALETSMSAPPVRRKGHTIRAGGRWKPGDQFVPKIWSGRPYHSSPVAVGPPITIVNTWTFVRDADGNFFIDGKNALWILPTIAANDGLSMFDFLAWFKRPFNGQIICYDPRIDYRPQDLAETTNAIHTSGNSISIDPYKAYDEKVAELAGKIGPAIGNARTIDQIQDDIKKLTWDNVTFSLCGVEIKGITTIQYEPGKYEPLTHTTTPAKHRCNERFHNLNIDNYGRCYTCDGTEKQPLFDL